MKRVIALLKRATLMKLLNLLQHDGLDVKVVITD